MRRCVVSRLELDSIKDYEEDFGMLYYAIVADINETVIISVAEEHYDKLLEAMEYERKL